MNAQPFHRLLGEGQVRLAPQDRSVLVHQFQSILQQSWWPVHSRALDPRGSRCGGLPQTVNARQGHLQC